MVAEAKELRVGNRFIAAGGEILTISEFKKKVLNGGWGVPLGCHGGAVCSEILGADCSIFVPEVLEDLEGSATTNFGDGVLECCEVFVGTVVGDHGDEDDLKFTEGFAFFTCHSVLAYISGNLKSSETFRVWWSWSWVGRLYKRVVVFRERDVPIGRDAELSLIPI